MRFSVGIILSLLVAAAVIQTTGRAIAGCPPNCDPVAPPQDKGKGK